MKALFEDSTMTFGEHLEELRIHLWRAVKGLLVALIAMAFFANNVVKLIVHPVEEQLKPYVDAQLKKRTKRLQEELNQQAEEQRKKVHLETTMTADQVRSLAQSMGVTIPADRKLEPVPMSFDASLGMVIEEIAQPLAEVNGRYNLRSFSAQESFMIYFKAVLGSAFVVASPWIFYQIYSFVAVGLYAYERRFVRMSIPFSVLLFLSGVLMCFYVVFPAMLRFFLSVNEWMDIEPDIRLSEWVGFAVMLMLIFGIVFQMPLFMLVLGRVGIVTHEQLASRRRMAIFVMTVIAALITPGGDPNTMVFLAAPMILLFELGLFLMKYFEKQNPFKSASDSDDLFAD